MKVRRAILLLIVLVMLASLVSCGNSDNPFQEMDYPRTLHYDLLELHHASHPGLTWEENENEIRTLVDMLKNCRYTEDKSFDGRENLDEKIAPSLYMAKFSRITVYDEGTYMVVHTTKENRTTSRAYFVQGFDSTVYSEIYAIAEANHVG